jgi:hypothetical protein
MTAEGKREGAEGSRRERMMTISPVVKLGAGNIFPGRD